MLSLCLQALIEGKLRAKGRGNMTDTQLNEMVQAWKDTGFSVNAKEITESKPVLYLFYKILMVNIYYIHISNNFAIYFIFQNSLWGKQSQRNRTDKKTLVHTGKEAADILR